MFEHPLIQLFPTTVFQAANVYQRCLYKTHHWLFNNLCTKDIYRLKELLSNGYFQVQAWIDEAKNYLKRLHVSLCLLTKGNFQLKAVINQVMMRHKDFAYWEISPSKTCYDAKLSDQRKCLHLMTAV